MPPSLTHPEGGRGGGGGVRHRHRGLAPGIQATRARTSATTSSSTSSFRGRLSACLGVLVGTAGRG
eukprot:236644-Pyramimonas_sp.AAC.1